MNPLFSLYVNQLFSAEFTMYNKSDLLFADENMNKKNFKKQGTLAKIVDIFSTAQEPDLFKGQLVYD